MAKFNPEQNRYYPSKFKTGDLHDDFRLLFSHIYALQDQVAAANAKSQPQGSDSSTDGPSTTKLQGLNFKATPPGDGQVPTYVAAHGGIEWGEGTGSLSGNANEVYASPTSGGPGGLAVRALVTADLPELIFTRGGTILSPTSSINVVVWYAPFPATVTNVLGYVDGSTGSVINARRNGSLNLLVSNLTLGTADSWTDGGAVQNTAISVGDKLEIMVVSVSGTPTEIAIEIQCTRP